MKIQAISDSPDYKEALSSAKTSSIYSVLAFRIQELEALIFAEREELERCRTDRENVLHAYFQADSDLREAAEYEERILCALKDCISTYTGPDKLVTAERIEAWRAAIKKPKSP